MHVILPEIVLLSLKETGRYLTSSLINSIMGVKNEENKAE
jgi:hypothetical protein